MNHFDNVVTKHLADVISGRCLQHSKTLSYNDFTILTNIVLYMFDKIIAKMLHERHRT
jgi:hypothetical protein